MHTCFNTRCICDFQHAVYLCLNTVDAVMHTRWMDECTRVLLCLITRWMDECTRVLLCLITRWMDECARVLLWV